MCALASHGNGRHSPLSYWDVVLEWAMRGALHRSSRRRVSHVSATVLSLLLLLLSLLRVCAEDAVPTVHVVSLMYDTSDDVDVINAINAGFDASVSARGWKTSSVARISVTRPNSYNTSVGDILQEGIQKSDGKLLIALGPLGTENVAAALPALKKNNVVGFAAMAHSNEARGWNPNLYFLGVGPVAELLALIRYAVARMGVVRLGMAYMRDGNGMESYESAVNILSMMGRELCGTFVVASGKGDHVSEDAEWEKFIKTRPQAVLLFANVMDDTTVWFINKMVQDDRAAGVYVLAPTRLQGFLYRAWNSALNSTDAQLTPGQLITAGAVPLANDNTSAMIQRFQKEMDSYLGTNEDWSGFAKPKHYLEDEGIGEMMVVGWLAGEILTQALNSNMQLTNRTAFMESLYMQRRYVIDDFVVGDFGGNCTDGAAQRGATCHCNQGGSMVYLKNVVEGFRLEPLPSGYLSRDLKDCAGESVEVGAPLLALFVVVTDDAIASRATVRWFTGAVALDDATGSADDRIFFHPLEVTKANATAALENLRDTKVVSAVFGVVPGEMLNMRNMTFINPIALTPRVNTFRRNVLHILPLIAQQLYVSAVYMSNTSLGKVKAFIRGDHAAAMEDVLEKSLVTFGLTLESATTLSYDVPMAPQLPKSGDVFTIGLAASDIPEIADHLQRHRRLRVFVPFNDIALLYDEFLSAFNATPQSIESSSRLLFSTSLPHWADRSSQSLTVINFHKLVVNESCWTPLTYLGFATARLLQTILPRMQKVSPELLSDFFFEESNIKVDDTWYGPFIDTECISGGTASANNCASNFGASNLSVWSMARVLNASVPVLQQGITPSLEYAIKAEGRLTRSQVIGVIVGSVLAVLLLVALCVLLYLSLGNTRDNDRAPMESSDPVTLIFTDIESSTAQWAAYPELMPDAVAAHHRMIRQVAGRYNCYEVKTVGDSFMIASKSPFAAVQLARDIQCCFLHHDWGTNLFDEFYRMFEEERASSGEGYRPVTACLDPDVYRELWNGLRVRIGIHTGLCDIRHDEVTKGYDYYGHTPNMAARTESVANGGQVLLTEATYLALSAAEREQTDVTSLGLVPLRGMAAPVGMYQLDAVPGRSFAALRLDREYFFDDDEGTTTSTSDHSSARTELSESAQIIVTALQSLLSTFKAPQREKLLMPYCERWRVPLPRKGAAAWDDGYCEEVVRRIAMKVGRVTDHGAHSASDASSSTHPSSSVIVISYLGPNYHEDY
ncbi:unnamed protein product [Trypanosoma congolense IL3000]|uniref:adenylate cyclase n=1 Tax=Trypanosoma congolense (strain IL3000) TaxID=1068625 RepID=F9W5R0_TRYCI|nr:unnamed protein product [Trypanosoma congolense IL3000]